MMSISKITTSALKYESSLKNINSISIIYSNLISKKLIHTNKLLKNNKEPKQQQQQQQQVYGGQREAVDNTSLKNAVTIFDKLNNNKKKKKKIHFLMYYICTQMNQIEKLDMYNLFMLL